MRRSMIAAATGLTLLALQPAVAARPAWAGSVTWGTNGHLYEAVAAPQGIGWVEAKLAASARGCGWYLATVTSKAEDAFVFGLVKGKAQLFVGTHGPWIGGYQRDSKKEPAGDWRWVTNEPFTYKAWAPGEPDNLTRAAGDAAFEPGIKAKQSQEVLHYLSSGRWDDANVNGQARGYVVEFDKVRQQSCLKLG